MSQKKGTVNLSQIFNLNNFSYEKTISNLNDSDDCVGSKVSGSIVFVAL
ncbi:hypothetical protein SDC9_74670 [bioreactor metagenome]|uniref:Uncharacterized protein n=1 Tax=bioreactor metagenome TaxID=1076179 RepID=A0A644YJT9_9ZZZZ